MIPNNILYIRRSGLCSAIIRVASSCSRWDKHRDPQSDIKQRIRHLATLSPKWDVSNKSLHSGIREPF